MIRLERKHLDLVAAIVREGSLTRAAEALALSQPAVSKQLAGLEAMLGTPLFERAPKSMRPTRAGRLLEARARALLGEIAALEAELGGPGARLAGRLRIATDPIHDDAWLGAALARFAAAHPGIEIEANPMAGALAALKAGRLEAAVLGETPRDTAVACVPLDADELVLVAPPAHPLARLPHVTAPDLQGCEIVYHLPLEDTILHRRHLAPAGVRIAAFHRIGAPAAILAALAAPRAAPGPVSVLPRRLVAASPQAPALAVVPIGPDGYRFRWVLAHAAEPSAAVRALGEALAGAAPAPSPPLPREGTFQTGGK